MGDFKTYYFMENDNWYTHDPETWDLILTSEAPKEARESYEEFLRDQEHEANLRVPPIGEDVDYDEDEEDEDESEIATKLFGV